jgi:alpha-L-fucosidase
VDSYFLTGENKMSHTFERDIPEPSPEQLAWQGMEIGMFFHFDIVTYAPKWDFRSWRDIPPPEIYNPVELDTDQWMEAAKAIGAKYAVFVAKHCSGFLQWQSDLYPYGVKQSKWRNGKGDVVRDFVESCRKYGIKPGIYASVTANGFLEVDNPGVVNRGKGGDQEKQDNYSRVCETMLTELWSRYGELTEVWFDGGALSPEGGGPDLIPILKQFQPNAIVFQCPAANIRWIGNESGVAGYPCWATVPDLDYQGDIKMLPNGNPDGKMWMPGECDVPIRNHEWFWTPDAENLVYSLDDLMDMYYRSVGRNCNLLLNANPDPSGLVPEADFKRYVEFGKEINRRFGSRLAEVKGESKLLELELGRTMEIDHVVIMEDIKYGERVRKYVIEALMENQTWQKLCDGTSIGHKRIERFNPIKTSMIRLIIAESIAKPIIRSFAVPLGDMSISA